MILDRSLQVEALAYALWFFYATYDVKTNLPQLVE